MRTLLYGSDRPQEPVAVNNVNDDLSIGDKPTVPSDAPRSEPVVSRVSERPSVPLHSAWYNPLRAHRRGGTLPAMTRGLIAVAVIWAGMALFLTAFVWPMTLVAQVLLVITGAWLAATGAAYVIAEAPSRPTSGMPRFA